MSRNYDNWERLVAAVLKRDQLWQLFHAQSRSPSLSSESSSLSFSFGLGSSVEDAPCSSPEWSAANHTKTNGEIGNSSTSTARAHNGDHQPESPVENLSPNKTETSKPFWKRALKIELPKLRVQQHGPSAGAGAVSPIKDSLDGPKTSRIIRIPSPTPTPTPCLRDHNAGAVTPLHPRAGKQHSESSSANWPDSAKQESYPLPLPPSAISKSSPASHRNSSETSPVPPYTPERVENSKQPGTYWKKGKFLGRSDIAELYLGFCSEKGEMCAMKEFRLSFAQSKQAARALEQEIALLSTLNHPNILQYYGSEMVGDHFYIYAEYMSGGSVRRLLKQYGSLGESGIRNYLRQILSGLAYLHSNNITHGDIKGDHILVSPNGVAKLSSFAIEKQHMKMESKSLIADSVYWRAPEAIMNPIARNPCMDIWSLGCVVVEMATSRSPMSKYTELPTMLKIINNKELPSIPDCLSNEGKDFLRHCFQWNPLHRATASQLLEHPFVASSSPLVTVKQGLPIPTSPTTTVTDTVKTEVIAHSTSVHQYGSRRHAIDSSKASRSNHHYTPSRRYISAPVSPVGSPLPHPNSPHGRMSPPLMSSPSSASPSSTSPAGGIGFGTIPHPLPNRSTSLQDTSPHNKSPGINTPSYWDPNILRGLHSAPKTHIVQEMAPSSKDAIGKQFRRTYW